MKRLQILLIMLLALSLMTIGLSCGGGPKPVEEEVSAIDTTTAIPEEVVTEEEEPPPPPPEIIKESQFETVYFDFDKFNLRTDSKSSLDNNYDLLVKFPDVMIKIEGHADERGTVEYNLSLGEKRARAGMDYLVGLGISASRISIISYGKERPIDGGHNETAWSKNRRAEFKIISQ